MVQVISLKLQNESESTVILESHLGMGSLLSQGRRTDSTETYSVSNTMDTNETSEPVTESEGNPSHGKMTQEAVSNSPRKKKGKNRKQDRNNRFTALQRENERIRSENESLLQELYAMKNELEQCQQGYRECKQENVSLIQRYSKVMSAQLLQANPSVKDLNVSDQASELAETFRSELYGNQWCDAMGVLEQIGLCEKETLEILKDICLESYVVCTEVLIQQASTIIRALEPFSSEDRNGTRCGSSGCQLTNALQKLPEAVRECFRNQMLHIQSQLVQEELFKMQMDYSRAHGTMLGTLGDDTVAGLRPYTVTCLGVCWKMLLQTPPMYLHFSFRNGDPVDNEMLDFYSFPGLRVDFIVWPVLYRYLGGPILNKGIVQAIKDEN